LNDRQEEAVDIQNNVDRLQILCKEYNVDLGIYVYIAQRLYYCIIYTTH